MIDIYEARKRLQKAATERGYDFIYKEAFPTAPGAACMYVKYDTPACIIGLAFWDVLPEKFIYDDDVDNVQQALYDRLTVPALAYAAIVQKMQDEGKTWGEAIDTADAAYYVLTENNLV